MRPGVHTGARWRLALGALVACFLFAVPCLASGAEVTRVRYPDMSSELDQRHAYFVDLLRLVLDKTQPDFGPYRLQPVPLQAPQGRILRMLSVGQKVDLLWSMTSRERERYLRPIRIPLARGVAGYRVLIIRKEDQNKFADIESVEQLAEMVAGQGEDWPDTEILRHNGLTVTTSGYQSLFTMLRRGRIDYIPRALNEPWSEVARRPGLDLAVERRLILHYPTAGYFFVRQDNNMLAKRLRAGLELALKDGSLQRLFREHPQHQPMFSLGEMAGRRMLRLENPLLPESTPRHRDELWWTPVVGTKTGAP